MATSNGQGKEKSVNIIAVDVGTTLLTCHLLDKTGLSKYNTTRKIEQIHPQPGYVEIEPYQLWEQFQDIIWETMAAEQITPEEVTCIGISTQRGTFLTWDRKTGKPQHNFITWQDLRASDHTEVWNKSLSLKTLQTSSKFLHMISRRKKFLAGSVINFSTQQASIRLHYMLKKHIELQRKAENGSLLFGTIDTWLLWKLTRNKLHITDYSNASSTGMFDPFVMEWSSILTSLLNIPNVMLPKIVDTSGDICESSKDIFGSPIPIKAVVADQQAAMFGQCCFDVGDIKCTLGTGTFINVNTGKYPHASVAGLYPLVAWKIGTEIVYTAEGVASGTATSIEWAQRMGFFSDVKETSDMAFSVENSDGVYFVPSFNGLQAPINDSKACVSLMGIKSTSTKANIVRAILESIAFRFAELYNVVIEETQVPVVSSIKCDGGVSNNDFVMELISSLTGQSMNKPSQTDMSALGAAFLAGTASGVWTSRDELKAIRCTRALFQPKASIQEKYKTNFKEWRDAVNRSRNWYP